MGFHAQHIKVVFQEMDILMKVETIVGVTSYLIRDLLLIQLQTYTQVTNANIEQTGPEIKWNLSFNTAF